jgi:hypothetical protein
MWFFSPDIAFSAAWCRYHQWLHSLAREDIPIRLFDFWSSSDRGVPVSAASHYVLGSEVWLGRKVFVRMEGYAKRYDRLAEPNPADDPSHSGDEFLPTKGHSDGLDLMVRLLDGGRWGGWLANSYGINRRRMDTTSYPPGQDRRHNLNVVASYKPNARYNLSARWGFGTGTPFTDIVGQFGSHRYNPRTGQWSANAECDLEPVGAARNSSRFPSTHRLDLSVTRDYGGRTTVSPFFSIVNAYNAGNVFMYIFDYGANPPTRKAISQLPLLPTFGVTVTF